MATVLLTGGAGFIGSHTADALIARGHTVRVFDLLDPQIHGAGDTFPQHLDRRIETIRGDVRDAAAVMEALRDVDAVFHFAARTGVGQSMYDVAGYVDHNAHGTAVLLDAVARRAHPLSRFVLASSRAVYGEGAGHCEEHGLVFPGFRHRENLDRGEFGITCPECGGKVRPLPTPEDTPLDPGSVYALTKRIQEDLCAQAVETHHLPLVVLRYFNVYGSRQSLHNPYTGVATVFFNRLRDGDRLDLYERGLPTRDFVHVRDVVAANIAALEKPVPAGTRINIGSGEMITIRQLGDSMARVLGVDPTFEDTGEFRVGDIYACTADLERAHALLGYEPRVSLENGLREFVEWADHEDRSERIPFENTVVELKEHGLLRRVRKTPTAPDGRR